MDLTQFLFRRGTSLAGLRAAIIRALSVNAEEIVFISGSLVEGFGNSSSDLDVYVIAPYNNPLRVLDQDFLEKLTIDVSFHDLGHINNLLTRFVGFSSGPKDTRKSWKFNLDERHLLHRICIGIPLWNCDAFQGLKASVPKLALARHKLDHSLHAVKRFQVDLAGCRSAGDWRTMLLAAQQLLGHTIDGLLAAYFETNPTLKWRFRLLQRLPSTWEKSLPGRMSDLSAADEYLALLRLPELLNAHTALQYSLRVVTFARRVFTWATWRLSQSASINELFTGQQCTVRPSGPPLFHLALDVLIVYSDSRFQARRLTSAEQPFDVSATAASLLCLFDGSTSGADATANLPGTENERQIALSDLIAVISHVGWQEKPIVDDDAIQRLFSN